MPDSHSTMPPTLSIVIPTYQRGGVLLATLQYLFAQAVPADEIIVVDQTPYQASDPVADQLSKWQCKGRIRWLKLHQPSIPAAMNEGLLAANSDLVLFLDDDIIPHQDLCKNHVQGFADEAVIATVGQILQPLQQAQATKQTRNKNPFWDDLDFTFNGTEPATIRNCMAGNLCVRRSLAIACGGFDERFTQVAYRFETEFIRRFMRRNKAKVSIPSKVMFLPRASIEHLQLPSGGTRAHSHDHLRNPKVSDGVGDYYFAYREASHRIRWHYCLHRLFRSVRTRFYLTHPWYLPNKIIVEVKAWWKASRMSILPSKLIQSGKRPITQFAAVISHPIQHYAPLFKALNALKDIEVHVIYLCDLGTQDDLDSGFGVKIKWDVPLLEGYDHTVLKPGFLPKRFSFWEMSSPKINSLLNIIAPDVIWLHGYSQKFIWDATFWSKGRATTIHFADSELLHKRPIFNRALKQVLLRLFFSQINLFMTVGDNNRAYYKHYGVPQNKLLKGACPIDVQRLSNARAFEPRSTIEALRQSLNIASDAFVILFSGKLADYKRPLDLVRALPYLPRHAHILFLGDGVQREKIQALASELSLSERVTVTGFINQSQLHRYMMLADMLAVTSERDAHPLVVTEGLVFGLPVVASDKVGCVGVSDTAQANKNALIYRVGNIEELARAINNLIIDEALYHRLSEHSLSIVESQSAESVADIINSALGEPWLGADLAPQITTVAKSCS